MEDTRDLEKQLKIAAKTGKYIVGRREVLSGIKGSKLLIWSASASVPQKILDESKSLSVPAVRFEGNPVELGKACGIPFRVSVIALKVAGDADLSPFSKASDYLSSSQAVVPAAKVEPVAEEKKPAKEEELKKSPRKSRKKVEEETPAKEKPKAKKAPRKKKKEEAEDSS